MVDGLWSMAQIGVIRNQPGWAPRLILSCLSAASYGAAAKMVAISAAVRARLKMRTSSTAAIRVEVRINALAMPGAEQFA